MVKNIFTFFVLLFLVFVYIPTKSLAAGNVKVGVVDLNMAGQESKRGREIVEKTRHKLKKEQEIIKKKESRLKELRKDLNKQGLIISEELRQKKEADYRAEHRSLSRHIKDAEEEIKISQREAMNKILKELLEIVKDIGKTDNYTYITTNEYLLYNDRAVDITDEVVRKYNKKYRNKKSSRK